MNTPAIIVGSTQIVLHPPTYTRVLARAVLGAGLVVTSSVSGSTYKGLEELAIASNVHEENQSMNSLTQAIRAASLDVSRLDEDERPPSNHVVEQICALVDQVSVLLSEELPTGVVGTFDGEISMTWRDENSLVRLACFPTGESKLVTGCRNSPLGSYVSITNPKASDIAKALTAICDPQFI